MAATATILDLVSVNYLTNTWVDWSDLGILGVTEEGSFDDQHCRSSNMAATAAIFDLVSVDYLTNAWVDWSNFFVAYWG
jgi:Fe-S cluster assembly iron-binding protein IscA